MKKERDDSGMLDVNIEIEKESACFEDTKVDNDEVPAFAGMKREEKKTVWKWEVYFEFV